MSFKAGSEAGAATLVKLLPDPPLGTMLSSLTIPSSIETHQASTQVAVAAATAAGSTEGTAVVDAMSASGPLSASWSAGDASGFAVSSLTASGVTITGAGDNPVGSGVVSLMASAPVSVSISGNAQYNVNGTGTLAFYGGTGSNLGVGADWDNYSATVSGSLAITLTTDRLTLNGQALPAGTYTIDTTSATLSGTGPSTSPNFAGAASVTATGGTVNLGPGAGNVAVGGTPIDSTNVATLAGYTGTIAVSAGRSGGDSVTLDGAAGSCSRLPAPPPR
jgi:hypothetical protein